MLFLKLAEDSLSILHVTSSLLKEWALVFIPLSFVLYLDPKKILIESHMLDPRTLQWEIEKLLRSVLGRGFLDYFTALIKTPCELFMTL